MTALTIAEVLAHESALTDLPTFARMTGTAESTVYQAAREGRLPVEVIRLGRKRCMRTVDVWKFLGLLPEENDNAPGVEPGAPVEQSALTGTSQ